MSQISLWILEVCSVAILGVIIEVIMPQGKMNKILKLVISLVSIFVIIYPIKNFKISNLNFSNLFKNFEINEQFIINRENEKIVALEKMTEKNLSDNGYKGVEIKIEAYLDKEKLNIKTVFVDLKKLVLTDENLNINKYTNITFVIKNCLQVDEKSVVFYE